MEEMTTPLLHSIIAAVLAFLAVWGYYLARFIWATFLK